MSDSDKYINELIAAGCQPSVAARVIDELFSRSGRDEKYSAAFEDFWRAFPKTPVMSKKQAFNVWKTMSVADRDKATHSLPDYRQYLIKHEHPAVHACRYLSQRRFDGFASEPRSGGTRFYASAGSKQLWAWDAYGLATKGRAYPRDKTGGWWFPSEWPPQTAEVAQELLHEFGA